MKLSKVEKNFINKRKLTNIATEQKINAATNIIIEPLPVSSSAEK